MDKLTVDPPVSDAFSFVVRIWLEETADETSSALWRGHITHVPSGDRRYLQNLDEMVAFVARYLETWE